MLCEKWPRGQNTGAGRKGDTWLSPQRLCGVVGRTQALEPRLCLNLRQQGIKGFAHSQFWAQFPTLAPTQAAQSLVGTRANNQITLFCTKCYGAKGKSNWLCAGDREKDWGKFHRGGCCWEVHRVEKGAQASWGSGGTRPHSRCT